MIMPKVVPLCPVFGECGGCLYQDIPYEEELIKKELYLKGLLKSLAGVSDNVFEPIVPSPKPYHYRHRLDLKMQRTKNQEIVMGFSLSEKRGRTVPIEQCFIAAEEISKYLPQLKKEATEKFSAKYREANLVIRSGDESDVHWGGIGRRSLLMEAKDYFWTEILGKKIYYSLDTFFQANLSILPKIIERMRAFDFWDKDVVLYDLYGGVGLFGICLHDKVGKVILIEETQSSVQLANYNIAQLGLSQFEVIKKSVEEGLTEETLQKDSGTKVAVVDPPRAGLSLKARNTLVNTTAFKHILYLSCNPEALSKDLEYFIEHNWNVEKIMPFDFFPKTKHLETLVLLTLE